MKKAYIGHIRLLYEFSSILWDPNYIKDINAQERVQRQTARFTSGDYTNIEDGSKMKLMDQLEMPTLETTRRHIKIAFLYKVAGDLVPVSRKTLYSIMRE